MNSSLFGSANNAQASENDHYNTLQDIVVIAHSDASEMMEMASGKRTFLRDQVYFTNNAKRKIYARLANGQFTTPQEYLAEMNRIAEDNKAMEVLDDQKQWMYDGIIQARNFLREVYNKYSRLIN